MVDSQKTNVPSRRIFDCEVLHSIGVGLNSALFRVRIEYAELQVCMDHPTPMTDEVEERNLRPRFVGCIREILPQAPCILILKGLTKMARRKSRN